MMTNHSESKHVAFSLPEHNVVLADCNIDRYLVKQQGAPLEGHFIFSDSSHRSSFKVLRQMSGRSDLTDILVCYKSGSASSTLLQLKFILYLPHLKKTMEIVSFG